MLKKNNNHSIFAENKYVSLRFWITYILFLLFTMILILLSSFPPLRSILILATALLLFFRRNHLIKRKWYIRIFLWIFLYITSGLLLASARPALIDRTTTLSYKSETEPVQIQNGIITGVYNEDHSVAIYAGIPYAKPPIGSLRWKAPQEPDNWNDIRKADHFSDSAVQTYIPSLVTNLLALQEGTQSLTPLITDNEISSEDCLYLNVWTSANPVSQKRPVIVFIHGGSFLNGSGSLDSYNGEAMAKKGAVFVTINYRLGIFGFMASPELTSESEDHTSGNYGILDQIEALKWVKNNIASFGGDPDNITIAGQSAGSMSVNILQASPLSKGLFQRVIGESASNFGSRGIKGSDMETLKEAEKTGSAYAKSLNNASLEKLRSMSSSQLLKASKNFSMRPIIDGYILPDSIYNIYSAGKENDVPSLIGYNANESSVYLQMPFPLILSSKASFLSSDEFREEIYQTYGSFAEEFLEKYPSSNSAQSKESQLASGSLQWFGWHMHTWATLQSQFANSPVYLYYFDQVQPGNSTFQKLGAYHSSEIAYSYGNLNKTGLSYTKEDYQLSDIMTSYWFNFALTGDPNGGSLPFWETFDKKKDRVMELGNQVHMIPTPNQDCLQFFDKYERSLKK